jgi:hypothetical protein
MLYTSDARAIDHIVTNTNLYGKGPVGIRNIQSLLGNGEVPAALSHRISNVVRRNSLRRGRSPQEAGNYSTHVDNMRTYLNLIEETSGNLH